MITFTKLKKPSGDLSPIYCCPGSVLYINSKY